MALTGRHVALMFIGGFGIIIAVNIALAVNAVRTFPGLEVQNSYVASQEFDAKRDAQERLGWTTEIGHENGYLVVKIEGADGKPASVGTLVVHVARPTEPKDGQAVAIRADGTSRVKLDPGLWRVDVQATGPGGTDYEYRAMIEVRG